MNARTKKAKLTLSADASYKAENEMSKEVYAQHVKNIANDFLKGGYMVQVVKGRTLEDHASSLRIFDVVDEVWEDTDLKVTAGVVHELVNAGLLFKRLVDGTEVYLHINHYGFGFNPPTNNGLPRNIKLGQLVPGRILVVRFKDSEDDLRCVLLEREANPKRSTDELSAEVLVDLGNTKYAKRKIVLNQVMEVKGYVELTSY